MGGKKTIILQMWAVTIPSLILCTQAVKHRNRLTGDKFMIQIYLRDKVKSIINEIPGVYLATLPCFMSNLLHGMRLCQYFNKQKDFL